MIGAWKVKGVRSGNAAFSSKLAKQKASSRTAVRTHSVSEGHKEPRRNYKSMFPTARLNTS